jgi:hypothetical protein
VAAGEATAGVDGTGALAASAAGKLNSEASARINTTRHIFVIEALQVELSSDQNLA